MRLGTQLALSILILVQIACSITASTATLPSCPTPTGDLQLLQNDEDGYCFLYPAEFFRHAPPFVLVLNPTEGRGDILGDAWLSVDVESAQGRTAAQLAEAQIEPFATGFGVKRTDMQLGSEPAVLVDGLPGPDPWRKVFVVHGERLYTLTFLPWWEDPEEPAPFQALEGLFETVLQTFQFLPPAKPLPTPTVQWGVGNLPPPLTFETPQDGETLRYGEDYFFKVNEIPEAEAYFWSFSQNGVVVWENLKDDQGLTSGGTYLIAKGSKAHSLFAPGPVEVTVRAVKGNFYADPTVITVILE